MGKLITRKRTYVKIATTLVLGTGCSHLGAAIGALVTTAVKPTNKLVKTCIVLTGAYAGAKIGTKLISHAMEEIELLADVVYEFTDGEPPTMGFVDEVMDQL